MSCEGGMTGIMRSGMIMQTVGIYDRIDLIYKETPGITVETNLYYLPVMRNSLVYKAAKLLMDEFHVQKGVHIRLENIPCCSRYGRRKQRCGSSAVWRQ